MDRTLCTWFSSSSRTDRTTIQGAQTIDIQIDANLDGQLGIQVVFDHESNSVGRRADTQSLCQIRQFATQLGNVFGFGNLDANGHVNRLARFNPVSIAISPITTNSSTSEKPDRWRVVVNRPALRSSSRTVLANIAPSSDEHDQNSGNDQNGRPTEPVPGSPRLDAVVFQLKLLLRRGITQSLDCP